MNDIFRANKEKIFDEKKKILLQKLDATAIFVREEDNKISNILFLEEEIFFITLN